MGLESADKYYCDCGSILTNNIDNIKKHLKSKKHQKYLDKFIVPCSKCGVGNCNAQCILRGSIKTVITFPYFSNTSIEPMVDEDF